IGITCAGLMWLPAAFQQAHGWTRLHASMIAGALVVGAPIMVWAIRTVGTVGATTIWVLHGVSIITMGLWLMHRRLLIGEMVTWGSVAASGAGGEEDERKYPPAIHVAPGAVLVVLDNFDFALDGVQPL